MAAKSLNISITESAIEIGKVCQIEGKYFCDNVRSYPVNNWASAEDVVKQWASAISDFTEAKTGLSLHIAMPGPFDYLNGISYIKENRNLKSLYGENVKQRLAAELSVPEDHIYFYNDAVCSLAAEYAFDESKGNTILGLYFNEGFGSALLQDGKIKDAELWSRPFLEGKAEDYFSIKWLRKSYFQLTGLNFVDVNEINNFLSSTEKDIFRTFTENLAHYIKTLVREYKTGLIVLGGTLLSHSTNILTPLKKRLSALGVDVKLLKSKLHTDAPLIGTAVLSDKLLREVNTNE